jgi:hypothetical protein
VAWTIARWGMPGTGFHQLSFMVSVTPLGGVDTFWLRPHHPQGILVVARAFFFRVVVVVGVNEAPVLRRLGEGWPMLPYPLDTMRNSSMESSIVTRCGVDVPWQVEPTIAVPSSLS